MPLRTAILLLVVGPVVVVIGVGGGVSLGVIERAAEKRLQEDIQLIARALEPPLTRALQRDRPGALQQALDSAFAFGRVYGAHVLSADGRVLAGAGRGTEPMLASAEFDVVSRARPHLEGYGENAGEPVYAYFVPLVGREGRFEALLQVTRQRSEMQQVLAGIRVWGGLGLGALVLVLVSLLLFGYRQIVVRPVEGLLGELRRIGGGERAYRLDGRGPDELRRIAESVNGMLDALQASEREVRRRQGVEADLRDDLRESRRLAVVGEFAAGVAHELGTPLSVVDGNAQRLARVTTDSAAQRAAGRIREQVAHMSDILRQLLAFSRRTEPRRREVALLPVLERARQHPFERYPGIHFDMPTDDEAAAIQARADPAQLEQAMGYLLANAAAHARSRVAVTLTDEAATVRVAIEDDGPGVEPEMRQRCFEPFFSTRPTGEGAGLGLSVVHGIVEAHGGDVAFTEPRTLGGARVELQLPGADQEAGE